ncbi:hypothetical protein GIB67_005514 [Kingdonia uniflora]|uniref:Uncharacterized protein n=1 Tax=Kingdonia uniflora TaxID=39325 RepID=A0A7J7NI57_9MAGN|nr:hypothetical protein GIB67_005514 [Kingdonia uniflora]
MSNNHNEQEEEDDESDTNFLKILEDEEPNNNGEQQITQQVVAHYLTSIKSTLVIRQITSQGLSFQLWPAATTLVTLLDNHQPTTLSSILHPRVPPLRILELGSGTGLLGIAAASILGANVTLTDLPHVLPNLQFNADANKETVGGSSVSVASLRWGEEEDMKSIGREFDVILGSDVVYYHHLYDPLLKTLRFFLLNGNSSDQKAVFVMSHLKRWKKESAFFKKARKMFKVQVLHYGMPLPGSRIGVVVYSFSGKS